MRRGMRTATAIAIALLAACVLIASPACAQRHAHPLTDTPDAPASGLAQTKPTQPHDATKPTADEQTTTTHDADADSTTHRVLPPPVQSASPSPSSSPSAPAAPLPTQPPNADQAATSPGGNVRPPVDQRPSSTKETANPTSHRRGAGLNGTAPELQPPTLPSYNLTNAPGTSQPANTPPLVPDAPSLDPVAPSATGALDKYGRRNRTAIVIAPDDRNAVPPIDRGQAQNAPVDSSSSSSDDDSDQVVTSDDPHSLPIPKSLTFPSGFPQPQRELGDQAGEANGGQTKAKSTPQQPSSASQQQPPHDPIVHLTPPPTGGWRAGDLRRREERQAAEKQRQAENTGQARPEGRDNSAAATANDQKTQSDQSPDAHQSRSHSYISPHGPSAELRRNQSQWLAPPDLHGPMPDVDPSTYKPAAAPEYWMPDEAHIAALDAARAIRRNRRVHAHGAGARTTRLASMNPEAPRVVEIRNNMLFADGQPFWIQGICYSPVPIGESVSFTPKGDYFTPDYAYIWQRDLPLIKAMGATTLRIYGWAAEADHTAFLDAVHAAGLKVLVTFYLGDAEQNPVFTQDQRNQILINFVQQVHRYADHPAILMWSFGNELNGAWNGFAKQFSDAFGCWWQAGCAGYSDTNSDCHWQSTCMYYQLFSWINAACRAAKLVTTRPIISGFADVDYMVGPTPWLDKVARFNYVLPDMDAWAVQLYRGWTFGGYFGMYRGESWKPMIVTEFGVDAYNDACGWPENNGGGCFNMVGEAAGGADDNGHFWGCAGGGDCAKPGVQAQAEWDVRLAHELMNQYVDRGGIVWGGFLMAWTDEWWKGGGTQDLCAFPCKTWDEAWCRGGGIAGYRPGGWAMCSWKAHFTCPNFDTNYHDLCGYWLAAAPDNYVNEEWFGITAPINCGLHKVAPDGVDVGYKLNSLYVRPAYLEVMHLWSGNAEVDTSHATCDALRPCWACSITYSIDDLNDGACEKECAIAHLAVGPGSSQPKVEKTLGNSLLRGPDNPTGFGEKFGIPLAVGAAVMAAAIVVSYVLWHKRTAEAADEPLLRQPQQQ